MVSELAIRITGKIDDLKKKLNQAEKEVDGFSKEAGDSVSSINGALSGVAAGIAATFSVAALTGFARQVFEVTSEFQKLGAVLTNTLGSSAIAQLRMDELQEFAAVTPFGVTELTNAFVKLSNQGFKPSIVQIRQLGDLASSTGKSFDQLAEAILDAQTGEYERLKEFGIRAKDAGDQVIFTFKGVATEVDKTSSSIREYITGLGDAEGVTGAMAAISETLAGQVSNLEDSYDQMLLAIGDRTEGAFSTAISWVDKLINKITDLNRIAGIAEKFAIEGDFWQSLTRFLGFGPDFTDRELAVGAILNAREETAKYIQTVIDGAKSTEDFQKGIDSLWKRMDDKRASGDAHSTIQGVVDAYNEGVKALVDAQREFDQQAGRAPDANFGKQRGSGRTGKSEAERDAERLEKALIESSNRVRLANADGREKEIERIKIWYDNQLKLAEDNAEATITLQDNMRIEIETMNRKYDQKALNEALKVEKFKWDAILKGVEKAKKDQEKIEETARKKREKEEKALAKRIYEENLYYSQQIGNAVGNALEDALGRGENFFKALRDEFKRTLIRMAADAAAAQIGKAIMSGINMSGGKSGGGFWGFLGSALGWAGKLFGGSGYSSGSFPTGNYGGGNFPATNPIKGGGFVPGVMASSKPLNINVTGVMRGQDIMMTNNRANKFNDRFNGGQ